MTNYGCGVVLLLLPKKEHLENEKRSLNSLVLTSLRSWAWKQPHTTSVSATTVLPSTHITTIIIIPLSPQTPNNCRAMPFQSRYFRGMVSTVISGNIGFNRKNRFRRKLTRKDKWEKGPEEVIETTML